MTVWIYLVIYPHFYFSQGERIKKTAEDLLKNHAEELSSLDDLLVSSQDLLTKGEEQRDIAEAMYEDAKAAYAKATEAVELGDKTLAEAEQTYVTLKGKWSLKMMFGLLGKYA